MFKTNMWLSFLLLGVVALASGPVLAESMEGSILFVAPHRLIITPNEKAETLSVSNKSDEARRYDLTMIDQAMDANGVTQRVDTFPYSVKRMVDFRPKRFTLNPGESQVVRVIVRRDPKLPDGDYHSHLLFREVPLSLNDRPKEAPAPDSKTVTFEIRTLYGIAVPIVVQSGKIEADIAMEDPSIGMSENGKTKQLVVKFKRSGNSEAAGKLSANYVQAGKPDVPVIEPQWIRMYRESDEITKKFDLTTLPAGASGGKIVLSLMRDEADPKKTIVKEISVK